MKVPFEKRAIYAEDDERRGTISVEHKAGEYATKHIELASQVAGQVADEIFGYADWRKDSFSFSESAALPTANYMLVRGDAKVGIMLKFSMRKLIIMYQSDTRREKVTHSIDLSAKSPKILILQHIQHWLAMEPEGPGKSRVAALRKELSELEKIAQKYDLKVDSPIEIVDTGFTSRAEFKFKGYSLKKRMHVNFNIVVIWRPRADKYLIVVDVVLIGGAVAKWNLVRENREDITGWAKTVEPHFRRQILGKSAGLNTIQKAGLLALAVAATTLSLYGVKKLLAWMRKRSESAAVEFKTAWIETRKKRKLTPKAKKHLVLAVKQLKNPDLAKAKLVVDRLK